MKRDVEKQLIEWKAKDARTPLIIRGARQVGKSYTVENFGKTHFQQLLIVNFEEKREAASCFEVLDVQTIIKRLELVYATVITPGKTLLFLDEIQLCPPAIQSLRYFKEKLPYLHVIAAGSLLEFVLEDEEAPLSFPVGRVRFLNMKPLSFREFLEAIGQGQWNEALEQVTLENPLPEAFHALLLQFVRDYFLVGGMPAAIKAYLQKQSYIEALYEQKALLDIYRLDLAKYGKKNEFAHLEKLFTASPEFVAKHFRYSKIDPASSNPSRDYKYALRKLQQANLISSVHATLGNGIPLKAEENDKKFKILFLDIGLLQCALEVDPALFTTSEFHQVNAGVLAEQFAGQELLAYADCYLDPHLFFWETEKGGSAEVDFITNFHGKVVPIEVKAGKGKRLTSIHTFLERKAAAPIGLHISTKPLAFKNNILSVPFYLIKEIPRLLKAVSLA